MNTHNIESLLFICMLLSSITTTTTSSLPPSSVTEPIPVLDDLRLNPPSASALIKSLRASLLENGYAHIPNFIGSSIISELLSEVESLRHEAFRSMQEHTVFQEDIDPSLSSSHVRNMLVSSSKLIIDNARIPPSSPLNALYHRREFLELIRRVVAPDRSLFCSGDKFNSCYYNIYEEGDGLGWHFDNSEFGVNLVLSSPPGGGEFEISSSRTRGEGEGDEEVNVVDVLRGRRTTLRPLLSPGSLCIFAGRDFIHRVSKVQGGGGGRINAIFTFETEEGVTMNDYGLEKFFGRR